MVAGEGTERLRPVRRPAPPEVVADGPAPDAVPRRRPLLRAVWVPLAIGLLAAATAGWAPGPTTLTPDEPIWLGRSDAYGRAIDRGDLDRATARWLDSAATMPGVTTMTAGLLGRNLARGTHAVGLSAEVDPASSRSPQVLRASRFVVTLWGAATIAVLVLTAGCLVGRRAAAAAGLLLACEPYLLGHLGVLHTDALVTLFGATSIVALMALRWGDREGWIPIGAPALMATATAFATLALLTKLTAVVLLVGGFAVVVLVELAAAARTSRPRARAAAVRGTAVGVARVLAPITVGAVILAIVLWPAVWTSPTGVWRDLRESAAIADGRVPRFFLGEATFSPGPRFLPVATVVRMSPWLLLAGGIATVAAAVHLIRPRADWPRRAVVAGLLLAPLPYLVVVGSRPKIYDRYGLPLWPFVALLVGTTVAPIVARASERVGPVAVRAAGAVVLSVGIALAIAPAPYRTAYASALVGGQPGALDLVSVGWGEGIEQLGLTVAERERGRCDEVLVRVRSDSRAVFPCGVLNTTAAPPVDRPYYLVRQVPSEQIPVFDVGSDEEYGRGEVIDEVRIDGVVFAQLWLIPPRPPASADAPP